MDHQSAPGRHFSCSDVGMPSAACAEWQYKQRDSCTSTSFYQSAVPASAAPLLAGQEHVDLEFQHSRHFVVWLLFVLLPDVFKLESKLVIFFWANALPQFQTHEHGLISLSPSNSSAFHFFPSRHCYCGSGWHDYCYLLPIPQWQCNTSLIGYFFLPTLIS